MKKSALLRSSFGLMGLMGAGGAVAGPMVLSSRNSKYSSDITSAGVESGGQVSDSFSQVNLANTDGISSNLVVNEIDDATSSPLVQVSQHEGGEVDYGLVAGPRLTPSSVDSPNLKKYAGFDELWQGLQKGFADSNSTSATNSLPWKEDLRKVFQKDGDVSGEWTISKEQWQDCKISESGKSAYCGFFQLEHMENNYKVKVGFNGSFTNNQNITKKRWEIVVVKQTANDIPTWYSAQTGGWQVCSTEQWRKLKNSTHISGCENWRWTDHFNGQERQQSNFWGDLITLSAAKTVN